MLKVGRSTGQPVRTDHRWIAIARLGVSAALLAYVLLFRALPAFPQPGYVRPAALVLVMLVAVLALLQLTPRFRYSHAFGMGALGADAIAVIGFLWLYSFDPGQYLFSLSLFVVIEGTLLAGVAGGLQAWGLTTAGF